MSDKASLFKCSKCGDVAPWDKLQLKTVDEVPTLGSKRRPLKFTFRACDKCGEPSYYSHTAALKEDIAAFRAAQARL